ncbi:MAG: hypothetical protein K4445_12730, partial [Deltaproteobacteria bacterium]
RNKPLVRAAVCAALYPLVGFSFVLVNGWLPAVAAAFFLAAFLLFFLVRRKQSAGNKAAGRKVKSAG